jgi:hypothetical protein
MWTDGQTDVTQLMVAFCNFVNMPKNCAMYVKQSDVLAVSEKMSPFTAHKNTPLAYNNDVYVTTSEVLTAVTMKITTFSNMMPCTMAFQRNMLPPSPTMKMVATGSSQTLIYFYQII